MALQELISTYGYAAILLGAFLEGETVLVLGGFAAYRGYLDFPRVLASAFLGTLIGDQIYFHLGRIKGQSLLERRPRWKARSTKVFTLLNRNHFWFILGFRFLYGLRTLSPFVIGASGIPPWRFLTLDLCGAFIWASAIGTAGYLFGDVAEAIIGDVKHYEMGIFGVVVVLGTSVWLVHRLRVRRLAARNSGKAS